MGCKEAFFLDIIVAVDARHFFDEIDFLKQIIAIRRYDDMKRAFFYLDFAAKTLEQFFDFADR